MNPRKTPSGIGIPLQDHWKTRFWNIGRANAKCRYLRQDSQGSQVERFIAKRDSWVFLLFFFVFCCFFGVFCCCQIWCHSASLLLLKGHRWKDLLQRETPQMNPRKTPPGIGIPLQDHWNSHVFRRFSWRVRFGDVFAYGCHRDHPMQNVITGPKIIKGPHQPYNQGLKSSNWCAYTPIGQHGSANAQPTETSHEYMKWSHDPMESAPISAEAQPLLTQNDPIIAESDPHVAPAIKFWPDFGKSGCFLWLFWFLGLILVGPSQDEKVLCQNLHFLGFQWQILRFFPDFYGNSFLCTGLSFKK